MHSANSSFHGTVKAHLVCLPTTMRLMLPTIVAFLSFRERSIYEVYKSFEYLKLKKAAVIAGVSLTDTCYTSLFWQDEGDLPLLKSIISLQRLDLL